MSFCVIGQYQFFYASVFNVYAKNCCKMDTVFIIKVALSVLMGCLAVEIKSKLKDSNFQHPAKGEEVLDLTKLSSNKTGCPINYYKHIEQV
jgi:hypothetical protein